MRKKIVRTWIKSKKKVALLASMAVLATASVAGTTAYLMMQTDPVTNIITLAEVKAEVKEEFPDSPGPDSVKENVRIENTGTAAVFVRAAVVFNWVKDGVQEGVQDIVFGIEPIEGKDYDIEWLYDNRNENASWVKGKDGYYYYTKRLEKDTETTPLFTACKVKNMKPEEVPEGYHLSVEVFAQSIQADGEDDNGKRPAAAVWGDKTTTITVSSDGQTLAVSPLASE